jgi:hypothetical protein
LATFCPVSLLALSPMMPIDYTLLDFSFVLAPMEPFGYTLLGFSFGFGVNEAYWQNNLFNFSIGFDTIMRTKLNALSSKVN